MASAAKRRLVRDLKQLQKEQNTGVISSPLENDMFFWNAVIFGPEDTPWEGGTFRLTLEFTNEYPTKPPTVKFATKIFHPNVYTNGDICLDILQNNWSSQYDVGAVLTSIQSLLNDPNTKSPANADAAKLYDENRAEYYKRVRKVVEDTWSEGMHI